MSFVLYTVAGIVAIAVITVVAIIMIARKQGPAILAARQELFEATGYVHPELPSGPPAEQAKFVQRAALGNTETRYQRGPIEFRQSATYEAGKRVRRQSWRMPLARPPAVVMQLADRSLSSFGKTAKEALTGSERTWTPMYPGPFQLADPALQRFAAFGPDPAAIERVVALPGMRDLLLACAEVDLVVTPSEIRLADPGDRNMSAARGGTAGRVRAGFAESIRATIPVHQRMIAILERVGGATA